MRRFLAVLVLVLGWVGPAGAYLLSPAFVLRVVDGDTLLVLVEGRVERVRLIGVNAPELREEEGLRAKGFVEEVLASNRVVMLEGDVDERDRYGRLLAYVWVRSPGERSSPDVAANMLNGMLVASGYARPMFVPPNGRYAKIFEEISSRGLPWISRD